MTYINGIPEVANPLLIVIPIILMILSGYTIGRIISQVRGVRVNPPVLKDLLYGNLVLNFLFISGFVVFGVLTYAAKGYFTTFTYILIILSIVAVYILLKSRIFNYTKIKSLVADRRNISALLGVALFVTVIAYIGILTYYHPIFTEYDAIYDFLLTSKSILQGDGLHYDFYRDSNITIRSPPVAQGFDAWLIHSFGYSSLRLFPIYFIFLASLFVYSFARNVTEDSLKGLFASSAFLITPAILVVASRFSLYQDVSFIFYLTTSFYFLSEIVRYDKTAKTPMLMLIVSLSLLPLTREVGLILSVAIFFLVPAIKFTHGNLKLRAVFTALSFLPLYVLTLYDLFSYGFTTTLGLRLMILLVANSAIFYIGSCVKNQQQFYKLIPNSKYLFAFVIPLAFIATNMLFLDGPYPVFALSDKFNESVALNREIFGIPNTLYAEMPDALQILPRIDILFTSLAVGSIFLFFKSVGFGRLIGGLKSNPQYAAILALLVFLVVVWSYLLNSQFQGAAIRHVAYFIPLLSVILVLGMNREELHYKLYYYGVIVFATFYFLFHNIYVFNYNNNFGGLFIEPNKDSIMTLLDLAIAAALIGPLLIQLKEQNISQFFIKYNVQRYLALAFIVLLVIQVHTLSSSGITLAPIEKIDQVPVNRWELDVFEVVDYLNIAEPGNILSMRAPAISFFTNRTNLDLYYPQVFPSVSQLLLIENSTLLKEKFSEMNIRYIVLPNENSPIYDSVRNLMNKSHLVEIIRSDNVFRKLEFSSFDVYKFDTKHELYKFDTRDEINLIDENHTWMPWGDTWLSHTDNLTIKVKTDQEEKIFYRAYLQTEIDSIKRPLLLSLDYASESHGKAGFWIEIRDSENNYTWSSPLRDTRRTLTSETLKLPSNIENKPLEIRLYIITEGVGYHVLHVKKALISSDDF